MGIRGWHGRYGDLLLAATLAAVFTVEVLQWPAADPARAVPAAVVAGGALALRRTTPLVAFVAAAAGSWAVVWNAPRLDNDSLAFIVIFFVSLYSLGRYSRGHEMWLGAVGVLAYIVVFLMSDVGPVFDLGDIAFATGFVGGPWAAGLAMRLRREREQVLAERNAALRREQAEREQRAITAERSRIARELHDVVSHAIAVTVLQARGGRKMLGRDEEAVRRSLDAIEHTNTQALSDMRRLLSLLRDTEEGARHDPQPSLERLDALVEHLRQSGLPVELEVHGSITDVPPGVDLSAYRIVQESLTNVLKHAGPGASARVCLTFGQEELSLSVADDGRCRVLSGQGNGVDGAGHGLIGIKERVAVVGGEVEAGPAPDGGFVVRARLPYAVDA